MLSMPTEGEQLYLYLAVSYKAVSVVLAREVDMIQHLVYYVSKSLINTKSWYPKDWEVCLWIAQLRIKD